MSQYVTLQGSCPVNLRPWRWAACLKPASFKGCPEEHAERTELVTLRPGRACKLQATASASICKRQALSSGGHSVLSNMQETHQHLPACRAHDLIQSHKE